MAAAASTSLFVMGILQLRSSCPRGLVRMHGCARLVKRECRRPAPDHMNAFTAIEFGARALAAGCRPGLGHWRRGAPDRECDEQLPLRPAHQQQRAAPLVVARLLKAPLQL